MSAELRTSLMATFGALVVRLVTSGRYRAYVHPRMGLLLLLAALALIGAAGSLGARLMLHPPSNPHPLRHNEAGSLHWHASRFELLLIAPVVLLAVMPATPLGAAAAAMRAGT